MFFLGFVGSLVLVGGDPGVGKSTLLLQVWVCLRIDGFYTDCIKWTCMRLYLLAFAIKISCIMYLVVMFFSRNSCTDACFCIGRLRQ